MIYVLVIFIFLMTLILGRGGGMESDGATDAAELDLESMFSDTVLQWRDTAEMAAIEYNVPLEIVLSVIDQESDGEPDRRGGDGEWGLMQLTQGAVTDFVRIYNRTDLRGDDGEPLSPEDLTNTQQIIVGTGYLRIQRNRWNNVGDGSWYNALRAYNAGFRGSRENPEVAKGYAEQVLTRAGWSATP